MTDKPLVRAFVSSTYVDLKKHRARVIATLRKSGLHVDPMEDWTADDREPKAFAQQRVDGCHLCILLVAFRRGYVPDGATLSIIQMEYEEAVRRGIAVLPFLLGDEEPWPRRFDDLEKEPGIRAWREEFQQRHGCGTFRLQPESLDVGSAVTRWVQDRATPAVDPAPAIAHPFDFGPYLEAKRQDFVGRQWLFEEIEQWRRGRRERSLLIVGDPGIGKSAIVAELVHRTPLTPTPLP